MSKSKRLYTRRKRHRENHKLQKRNSVRKHVGRTGRKGGMHCKKIPSSKTVSLVITIENPGIGTYL